MKGILLSTILVAILFLSGQFVHAQQNIEDIAGTDPSAERGIVPCDGTDCGFDDLIRMSSNLINWLIYISIPIAAVVFMYAGVLYVTAAGNPSRVSQAHELFKNVAFGLVIVLAAWLIVYTITNALLEDDQQIQLLSQ